MMYDPYSTRILEEPASAEEYERRKQAELLTRQRHHEHGERLYAIQVTRATLMQQVLIDLDDAYAKLQNANQVPHQSGSDEFRYGRSDWEDQIGRCHNLAALFSTLRNERNDHGY